MQPLLTSTISHLNSMHLDNKAPFIQYIQQQVIETVDNAKQVAGFNAEEFQPLKEGLKGYWETLVKEGKLEITGTDKDVRSYFVSLQAIIEHVLSEALSNKNLTALEGVIHTPMPATPLCTQGKINKGLVDPAIEADDQRRITVESRAVILRQYLSLGGRLYIAYPQKGIEGRTSEQQKIYETTRNEYPSYLFDVPLNCDSLETRFVGAYYLFEADEKQYGFAIQMTQANDPQGEGSFGLWFGDCRTPAILERLNEIYRVLSPDTHIQLPQIKSVR